MVRIALLLTCLTVLVALLAPTAASAREGPCSEDPADCGFAPTISGATVRAMKAKAGIAAFINPGEQTTSYEIWISYAPCQGGAGECSKPVQQELLATGTVLYKRTRKVGSRVETLTPGCTYGYWLIARNERGLVETEHAYFTAGRASSGPKECGR